MLSVLFALPNLAYGACGNGVVEAGEECDDGNTFNCDVCTNDCTLGPQLDLVSIPAGNFFMGSAAINSTQPIHKVNVGDFVVSRAQVSVSQYRACVTSGNCTAPSLNSPLCTYTSTVADRENHPVNCITWSQAKDFTLWCSDTANGINFSLPSESQWEYIARGG